MARRTLVVLVGAVLCVATATAAFAGPTWPVYHGNGQRTGNDTSEPALLPSHTGWTRALDGSVYGQPVVFGGRVFAATENDTLYSLDAQNGAVLWARHLGLAMSGVVAQVGCGNIDPLGITSTAVVDTTTHTIYVVATIQGAFRTIHHQLLGLDTVTGQVRVSSNADPGGGQNPLYIQQRAGLALGNGRVYIGYGGYAGDCGPYHGWLVSLDEAGHGKVAFNVTPHQSDGAIWAPSGPSLDSHGNVYVSTGNPDPDANDFGESVLKFDATPAMHLLKAFKTFPGGDNDISSTGPAQLPNNMLFQIGKQQIGYLLDTTTLTALHQMHVCNGDAQGGTAFDGAHLFVPCAEHVQEVNIDVAHRSMSLGWTGPPTGHTGSPIIAAGTLWSIDRDSGTLYALNPATGAVRTTIALGAVPHFASPSAALGLVLIGTHAGVTALAGPAGLPPHAPNACIKQSSHRGYWIAARDGNVFAFGGAPSCGSLVGVHLKQPIVGMAATPSGNGYWLVARDGGIFGYGDAHFYGSTGSIRLNQPIVGMAATPSGNGYWLVARDGGIFGYGDAHFYGSTGGVRLAAPIVGMTAHGPNAYWLVGGDGRVFGFGVAGAGSATDLTSAAPAVALARD